MRLAFLADNHPAGGGAGGIGTYTQTLGRRLGDLGHDVHTFAFGPTGDVADGAVTVHLSHPWARRRDMDLRSAARFSARKLGGYDLNAFQLASMVEAEVRRAGPFDVLETPEFGALGRQLVGHRRAVRTLAVRLHGAASLVQRLEPEQEAILNQTERDLTLAADVITAPSAWSLRAHVEHWGAAFDAAVVGNPILLSTPGPHPRTGPDVLFVGRLEDPKGIPLLVQVLERMHQIRVDVVGLDGVLHDGHGALAALVATGQDVRYHGVLPPERVSALMRGARTVVVPSRRETFGIALLESMAAGTPTVASDIEPFRELTGGMGAVLVDADDPDPWVDALTHLLENPEAAAALGHRGADRARTFSVDTIADRMLDVWTSRPR